MTDQSPATAFNPENELVSPESVSYHRISTELPEAFKRLRKQFWVRSVVITVLAAALSCIASSIFGVFARGVSLTLTSDLRFALAVTVAAAIAVNGLYPILHKGEHYLFETASLVSRADIELLSLLGKLTELRGGDTAGHTLRVTVYTMLFAERMHLPRNTLMRAVKGALLHDVGKLVMPDAIIRKPGALTADERVEIEQHVLRGLEIVRQSELLHAAENVIEFHHERYDGSGYPHGTTGRNIPLEARLFALVDVFDALTSARAYKPALTAPAALDIMAKERGTHFDPGLFDRFVEMAPFFTRILTLNQGELKAMLVTGLTPYLDVSEISYLRHLIS